MINYEALFKISYGLYIVSSGDKNRDNGYISNTIFQVSSKPSMFAACCNKYNFTAGLITQSGCFAVSVLHQNTSPDIYGRFGYKSGKDFNKLEGMQIKYGETGTPIVLNDSIAILECKVVQTFDVGTHLMFIGELVQSEIINDSKEPITYLYYRMIKKGLVPENAPTYIDKSKLEPKIQKPDLKKFKCSNCRYIYDEASEDKKFSDLPYDWTCLVCGAKKVDFIEI
jgi:flavin reductase (DIM6/NTAB) family NADH-FMN oxidoreductase RutF/rubredoxin